MRPVRYIAALLFLAIQLASAPRPVQMRVERTIRSSSASTRGAARPSRARARRPARFAALRVFRALGPKRPCSDLLKENMDDPLRERR